MPLPPFTHNDRLDAKEIVRQLADRIRLERRRKKLSQEAFAIKSGIALRTYKRLESGDCDSFIAFIKVISAFERIAALELLFPPKDSVALTPSSPVVALERLRRKINK